MRTIYMFDVDGTLTPARQKIVGSFAKQFADWSGGKEVYLISGGSFVRICGQITPSLLDNMTAVYACMGNAGYERKKDEPRAWIKRYEHAFEPPAGLIEALEAVVRDSTYADKKPPHWEARSGMLNFSVVGQKASQAHRKAYAAHDVEHRERETIVKKLRPMFPKIDFVIGGAVSLDIFEKGRDKSQVIREHFKDLPKDVILHFVGDRVEYPGNDYALAQLVREHPNGQVHSVKSWKDTAKLLKSI